MSKLARQMQRRQRSAARPESPAFHRAEREADRTIPPCPECGGTNIAKRYEAWTTDRHGAVSISSVRCGCEDCRHAWVHRP